MMFIVYAKINESNIEPTYFLYATHSPRNKENTTLGGMRPENRLPPTEPFEIGYM